LTAKKLVAMLMSPSETRSPESIIKDEDWEVSQLIEGDESLTIICKSILENSSKQVTEYKAEVGRRDRIFPWFVGQAMKQLKGKGNPSEIGRVLSKLLQEVIDK
jgi:aspartyl-tRNA(Asn)/glutamyl-tRNA(Gln) amidotransferase subunit B